MSSQHSNNNAPSSAGAESDERKKVLRRLKKILALQNSDNPGEAAAALHQANILMAKHGLTSLGVAHSSIKEAEIALSGAEMAKWENCISKVILQSLGVAACLRMYPKAPGFKRPKAVLVFIGESCRAQIAVYAYEALRKKFRKDLRVAFNHLQSGVLGNAATKSITQNQKNIYAHAWCEAIKKKVEALAPAVPASVESYMLTRVPTPVASAPEKKPRTKSQVNPTNYYMYLKGLKDGQSVDLHKGLGQDIERPRMIGA